MKSIELYQIQRTKHDSDWSVHTVGQSGTCFVRKLSQHGLFIMVIIHSSIKSICQDYDVISMLRKQHIDHNLLKNGTENHPEIFTVTIMLGFVK